jgi:hypothetical protein
MFMFYKEKHSLKEHTHGEDINVKILLYLH